MNRLYSCTQRVYSTLSRYSSHTALTGGVTGMVACQYAVIKDNKGSFESKRDAGFVSGVIGVTGGCLTGLLLQELFLPCTVIGFVGLSCYASSHLITKVLEK